jgi:hypothetical protein
MLLPDIWEAFIGQGLKHVEGTIGKMELAILCKDIFKVS